MTSRSVDSTVALATMAMVVSLAAGPVAAGQAPSGEAGSTHAAPTWTPPRLSDGQPDVQGSWNRRVVGMATYSLEGGNNELHVLIAAGCSQGDNCKNISREDLAAQVKARPPRFETIIKDPADGKVPYQPWAWAKRQDVTDNHTNPRGPGDVDPMSRCFLVGVPRINYQSQVQILQSPGYVLLNYDHTHTYRLIPVDGRPHVADTIKLWMGDSRGRWEGNTLIVDSTNHNDKTWFDIIGTFHSDALHVVERFTFVDADTVEYEAMIEDPKVFTRPWKIAFPLMRSNEEAEQWEMACYEGNRSYGLMLDKQ